MFVYYYYKYTQIKPHSNNNNYVPKILLCMTLHHTKLSFLYVLIGRLMSSKMTGTSRKVLFREKACSYCACANIVTTT